MPRLTRRDMVQRFMVVAAGTALAGQTTVVTANASPHSPHGPRTGPPRRSAESATEVPEAFDEMYLGRHIEGWPADGHDGHDGHDGDGHDGDRGGHAGRGRAAGRAHATEADGQALVEFTVRVDDDDLHVMQNADGTWISVIDHYEKHPTPRDAARAAVRDLHGASLVPVTV